MTSLILLNDDLALLFKITPIKTARIMRLYLYQPVLALQPSRVTSVIQLYSSSLQAAEMLEDKDVWK